MRSMVEWVCQIMTSIRHGALIFDVRLFAGNAADDTLVAGGTLSFCHLMCLCVKQRNIILNSKRRSLSDSALFRADNRTEQKAYSPFSLALILTFDFCRSFRTSFLPGGSLPAFCPRWYASSSHAPYRSLPCKTRKFVHFAAPPLPTKAFAFVGALRRGHGGYFAGGHIPFGRSCNFQGSGAIARPF